MKETFFDLCSESTTDENDVPVPYPSELDTMNSLISKKVHQKRLEISKLNTIEEYLEKNYKEKINNISMNRKKIVHEINSLQSNSEENL